MSDQAPAVVTIAEPPSLDSRLDAAIMGAIGGEPEPLEDPTEPVEPGEEPDELKEPPDEPAEPAEGEEPVEAAEAPQSWDEVRDIKFKVPIKNGDETKEIEASLEELRLGYMRTDDYQRKTQELSRQRGESQQAIQNEVLKVQGEFANQLKAMDAFLMNIVAPEFQNVNWNDLATNDPAQFVALSHRANQVQQARQSIAQQIQQAENQRMTAEQQRLAQALPQAEELLKADIPSWGPELKQTLAKAAMEQYGYTPQDIEGFNDPRLIRLLHDAHQWRQVQAQKPISEKKVVAAPKVLKPGARPANQAREKSQELVTRIRKTGGRDEAALDQYIQHALR